MRKMMVLAVALAAFAAPGCGGKQKYVSHEKSQVQQDQDLADCDWEASRATGNVASSGERKDRIQELVDKCMKAKGYKMD